MDGWVIKYGAFKPGSRVGFPGQIQVQVDSVTALQHWHIRMSSNKSPGWPVLDLSQTIAITVNSLVFQLFIPGSISNSLVTCAAFHLIFFKGP